MKSDSKGKGRQAMLKKDSPKKKKPPDEEQEDTLWVPSNKYKCVKTRLYNVLNKDENTNNTMVETIKTFTEQISLIGCLGREFIASYVYDLWSRGEPMEPFTEKFIISVLRVVTGRNDYSFHEKETAKNGSESFKQVYDRLVLYYNMNFAHIRYEITRQAGLHNMSKTAITNCLTYEARKILTDYKNNTSRNYPKYVKRYVDLTWKKYEQIQEVNSLQGVSQSVKQEKKKVIYKTFDNLFLDIIHSQDEGYYRKSNIVYHYWLNCVTENVVAQKYYGEYGILYDLKADKNVLAQDYIYPCIFLMEEIQSLTKRAGKDLYQIFPQRSIFKRAHVTIDTDILLYLIDQSSRKAIKEAECNDKKELLWSKVLNMDQRIFRKKGYLFNNQIETDGVSIRIQFIKEELYGKKQNNVKIPRKSQMRRKNSTLTTVTGTKKSYVGRS